ncbi:hypothetical protein [Sulfuracidifex metallicus]|uniref:hypothetical protein n=1 Tax=Sulfuracidifex metallicus TaxID=47303 RepID=UPI00227281BB|nr:hypothetical protein [Sulfuracidifex metallicus]MCY0850421.1 hypothetical protein [Sulfuracidifex metallicus]
MKRIVIPKIIEVKLKKRNLAEGEFFITISSIPPLITMDNADEMERKLLVSIIEEKKEEVCVSYPRLCYPSLYGGVFIFREDEPVMRLEKRGYIRVQEGTNEEKSIRVEDFLNTDMEGCIDSTPSVCFSRERRPGLKWIDNIGLRYIMGIR